MAESMQGLRRTHRCAEVTEAQIGSEVFLMKMISVPRVLRKPGRSAASTSLP